MVPRSTSGADQVNTGVQTLNTKVKAISQQVTAMQSGLTSADDQALGTIADGSTSMKQYLTELQHSYWVRSSTSPMKL